MSKRRSILSLIITLFAFFASGCGAISGYFATETPTPTNTPVPTSTPIPEPTSTATPEPTLAPSPVSFISQEELSDGSTLYRDFEVGYQIIFSPDWFILDLSEGGFQEILETGIDVFSDLDEDLSAFIKENAAQNFRAIIVDINREHISDSGFANISIIVVQDQATMALPLDFFVDFYAQSLPNLLPNTEVTNSKFIENASGLPIGIIDIVLSIEGIPGGTISQTQVIFKAEGGLVIIVFTSPDDILDLMTPIFEEIYDTIALLDQE